MIPKEILKKIRQIEIHAKRMLSGSHIGEHRVTQTGFGLEFNQLREYQPGDDVRFIDWKSSARLNKLLTRQYYEERNRIVQLAVDVSASSFYGSGKYLKYEVMAQVASVLALVADYGKDLVGLILFADDIELYMEPKKGRAHVHRIMQKLFEYKNTKKKTNFSRLVTHLANRTKKNTITFIISDFIDSESVESLKTITKLHELVALRCLDTCEHSLKNIGFLEVQDIESNQKLFIDTRENKGKKSLNSILAKHLKQQNDLFKKYNIDWLDIWCDRPFTGDLVRFFRRRMQY